MAICLGDSQAETRADGYAPPAAVTVAAPLVRRAACHMAVWVSEVIQFGRASLGSYQTVSSFVYKLVCNITAPEFHPHNSVAQSQDRCPVSPPVQERRATRSQSHRPIRQALPQQPWSATHQHFHALPCFAALTWLHPPIRCLFTCINNVRPRPQLPSFSFFSLRHWNPLLSLLLN